MRVSPMLIAIMAAGLAGSLHAAGPARAPEFTHSSAAEWINSEPRTLASLRGQVVLVEFWTFGCSNCRRTLPWLKAMHAQYRDDGLVIVSVHSPEFADERDGQNVRAAVKRLGIDYPVMIDNDFSYWNALENRYWPAFYLIGRAGEIEATAIGELHRGDVRGDRFEQRILALLTAR